MKKAALRKIILGLIALLIANNISLAEGNYATFAVSCTIPAIPGVNSPPYDNQEGSVNQEQLNEATSEEQKKNTPSQASIVIVEKTEDTGRQVETIYSR